MAAPQMKLTRLGSRSCFTAMLSCLLCLPGASAIAQRTIAITNARIETAAKAGTIENGCILIEDGKIKAVGSEVKIPIAAQVVDAKKHTIIPGIVDPYYVVTIGRNVQATPTRTIVFRGRTFVIGGGSTAIATTFARVADGFDPTKVSWDPALRSGITTLHLVTGGYAQSAVAEVSRDGADEVGIAITKPEGLLVTTASNDSKSLDVIRNGVKKASATSSGSRPTPEQIAAMRARMASRTSGSSRSTTSSSSQSKSPTDALWSAVREGKSNVFVNVNNASSVLHVDAILSEQAKAKVALVAAGPDLYLSLPELSAENYRFILPPRIDLRPSSQYRINVPAMLAEQGQTFAFSLSLGQSDFRNMQHNPLFSVGMLIRAGLDRELALKALTLEPAKLLGLEKDIGSIEVGKAANLVVFDGDPFAAMSEVQQVFVGGKSVHVK